MLQEYNKSLGFTLIEMIIVLVIIAILAATGFVAVQSAISSASTDNTSLNVDQANVGITNYYLANYSYPTLAQMATAGTVFSQNVPSASIPTSGTYANKGLLTFTSGSGTWYVVCYTGSNCTGNPASTGTQVLSCCSS